MKIVYIAHPIGGDVEANLKDLIRIIRKLNLKSPFIVPFCPYYADVIALNDSISDERERGMSNDIEILKRGMVDEVWLTGSRISAGMEAERRLALSIGIPVRDFTNQL